MSTEFGSRPAWKFAEVVPGTLKAKTRSVACVAGAGTGDVAGWPCGGGVGLAAAMVRLGLGVNWHKLPAFNMVVFFDS